MYNYILFGHYFILIFGTYSIIRKYRKDPVGVYLNYISYLFILGIFYFTVPSLISLETMISPVNASEDTIIYSAQTGLYFNSIFFLGFLFSFNNKYILIRNYTDKNIQLKKCLQILGALIFLFFILLFIFKADSIISAFGQRRLQADLDYIFNSTYKVYLLGIIQILIISYLFLTTSKKRYLFYYLPFVIYGFLLSDRDFIFNGLLVTVLCFSKVGIKINPKYIIFGILTIFLIGILRSYSVLNNPRVYMIAIGEFIYTWSTTHLIIESSQQTNILESIVYAVSKLGIPGFYNLIFDQYSHYSVVVSENNPIVGTGLGGSVVSEALSYKNNFILFLYPLILVIYGLFLNYVCRNKFLTTSILFIISIIMLRSIIRFSLIDYIFYPFSIIIFYGFWLILVDVKNYNNER